MFGDHPVCAIHQPFVYPWPGYVAKALHPDFFVLMETVQFQARGFMRRNKIRMRNGQGWGWLTVPVLNAEGRLPCKDVQIDGTNWVKEHVKALATEYGRCAFFNETMDWLRPVLEFEHKWFVDLALDMLLATIGALRTPHADVYKSMDLCNPGGDDATGKLLWICRAVGVEGYVTGSTAVDEGYLDAERFRRENVAIWLQKVKMTPYKQQHGGWEPGMSTVDLMMNVGAVAAAEWINSNVTYEPWG